MNQIKVELLNLYGTDVSLATAVWVSSGRGNPEDPERVRGLIEMLIREGHESCFERISAEFHVRVPQRIGVQILRHRLASHNAASSRYGHKFDEMYDFAMRAFAEMDLDWDVVDHLRDLKRKAGILLGEYNLFLENIKDHPHKRRLRELASFAIGQGVMVEQTLLMNFRSLRNFLEQRLSPHAQAEVREVARQMRALLDGRPEIQHSLKFLPEAADG